MRLKQGQRRQVSSEGQAELRVDIDLSALPISKHAEGAKKGYVAKSRTLIRVS